MNGYLWSLNCNCGSTIPQKLSFELSANIFSTCLRMDSFQFMSFHASIISKIKWWPSEDIFSYIQQLVLTINHLSYHPTMKVCKLIIIIYQKWIMQCYLIYIYFVGISHCKLIIIIYLSYHSTKQPLIVIICNMGWARPYSTFFIPKKYIIK